MPYYEKGELPIHDPADADDLGLEWALPLRAGDAGGLKQIDLGGVFCPTLKGRAKGSYANRYRGMHRGHDLGVSSSRLAGKKIPVRAIADGIYDGQRIYKHADALPNDCKPIVVYHESKKDPDTVYTSIYCHLDAMPDLKPGTRVKKGDVIGHLEDPKGAWSAHVHLELYTRPVYASKDSTKLDRCKCRSAAECDAMTRKNNEIPRGCGIFEDDTYILDAVSFINSKK